MRIIFCADYWDARQPDSAYEAEVQAVAKLDIRYDLLDFAALTEQQNAARAVRRIVPAETEELAIYRGWMLRPQVYVHLASALAAQGLVLINSPLAYLHCHYLPEAYPLIEGQTPRSTWIRTGPELSMDAVMAALAPFGDKPVIVKDFVKSRKHEWDEACYIPSAADRQGVERVVRRFLALQGEDLNEGLVFREFVEFEPLTTHSQSGMPLIKEYRLFVLDSRIISATPYWEEGDYGPEPQQSLPLETFTEIAQKIQSRFFTMDVARKLDGSWQVVELGDGQVAGLPARLDPEQFYRALSL